MEDYLNMWKERMLINLFKIWEYNSIQFKLSKVIFHELEKLTQKFV